MSSSDDPILNDFKVRIATLWDFGIKFIWFKINNMKYSILSSCLGYPVEEISDIIKFTNLSRQPDRVASTIIWGQLLGFQTEQCQFYNKKLSEHEQWIRFTGKVLIGSARAIGRKRNLSPPQNLSPDQIIIKKKENNWSMSTPHDSFQIEARTSFLEKLIVSGISQSCELSPISYDYLQKRKHDYLINENKLLEEKLSNSNIPINSIEIIESSNDNNSNKAHFNIFNSWTETQQAEVVAKYLNNKTDENGVIPDHFTFTAKNQKKTHLFRVKASETKEDFKICEDGSMISINQWKSFYKRIPKELFKLLLTVLGGTLYNGILLCAKMLVQIDPKSMKEGLKDFDMNVCRRLDPAATLSVQKSAGLTASKRIKLCSILKYHLGFYIFSNEDQCSKIKNKYENIYTYKNYDYLADINSSVLTRITYYETSIFQIVINHIKTLRDSHSTPEKKNLPGRLLRKSNSGLALPLLIGGDGGGGEMKIVVCPSFRSGDAQTFGYNAGGYEGKEDYTIMLNTLCKSLNETIEELNNSIFVFVEWAEHWDFVVVPKILFKDHSNHLTLPNCFQFSIVDNEKLILSWVDNNAIQSKVFDTFYGNEYILTAWMPTLIVHGGDTKYFCMMLGMDGYSGKLCYLCKKSDLNWQTNQTGLSELWTHESMNKIVDNNKIESNLTEQLKTHIWGNDDRDALYLSELGILTSEILSGKELVIAHILKIKADREGTGLKLLKGILQSIPLCHWICPILHIKLGICTRLLNFLYDWIFENLEYLTPEMININLEINILYQEYVNLLREQSEAESEFKLLKEGWNVVSKEITKIRQIILKKEKLKNKQIEVVDNLTSELYQILLENELISNNEFRNDEEDLSLRIIELANNSRIILKAKLDELSELYDSIKDETNLKNEQYMTKCSERKELREKSTNRPLQHEFDKLLNRFGIARQQYHTSSLIGKHCDRLARDTDEIMIDLKILLKTSVKRREVLVNDIDLLIDDIIEKMTELLKTFDCICHFVCRTTVISTDEDIESVTKLCNYFDDKWGEYGIGHKPPKLHMLKDHVPGQLDYFGNMGDLSEELVERSHHIRHIFERIFANIQNWEKQNKTIQSRVSQYNTTEVQEMSKAATDNARRKFNSADGKSLLARKKSEKESARESNIKAFVGRI